MPNARRFDAMSHHDTTNSLCLYVQWSPRACAVRYVLNTTGQNFTHGYIFSAAYFPWRGNNMKLMYKYKTPAQWWIPASLFQQFTVKTMLHFQMLISHAFSFKNY